MWRIMPTYPPAFWRRERRPVGPCLRWWLCKGRDSTCYSLTPPPHSKLVWRQTRERSCTCTFYQTSISKTDSQCGIIIPSTFLTFPQKNNVSSSRARIDTSPKSISSSFAFHLTQALLICQEILQLPNYHTHAQIFHFLYVLVSTFLSGRIAALTYRLRKLQSLLLLLLRLRPSAHHRVTQKLRVRVYFWEACTHHVCPSPALL